MKNPLTSDGIEKVFATDILGRFILLTHAHEFLKQGALIVNVLASGIVPTFDTISAVNISGRTPYIEGEWISGRNKIVVALGDLLNLQVVENWEKTKNNFTLVGTHPGIIDTEIFLGQEVMEFLIPNPVFSWILGVKPIAHAGLSIASILVKEKFAKPLIFFDEELNCRVVADKLTKLNSKHGKELWKNLENTVQEKK